MLGGGGLFVLWTLFLLLKHPPFSPFLHNYGNQAVQLQAQAMSSLCLNSIPFPPPSSLPRKLTDNSSSLLLDANNHTPSGSLKPIIVNGNPPTFVSAPGRRIIAGLFI